MAFVEASGTCPNEVGRAGVLSARLKAAAMKSCLAEAGLYEKPGEVTGLRPPDSFPRSRLLPAD